MSDPLLLCSICIMFKPYTRRHPSIYSSHYIRNFLSLLLVVFLNKREGRAYIVCDGKEYGMLKREIFFVCVGQSNVSMRYHKDTHASSVMVFSPLFSFSFLVFLCAKAQEHVKQAVMFDC